MFLIQSQRQHCPKPSLMFVQYTSSIDKSKTRLTFLKLLKNKLLLNVTLSLLNVAVITSNVLSRSW